MLVLALSGSSTGRPLTMRFRIGASPKTVPEITKSSPAAPSQYKNRSPNSGWEVLIMLLLALFGTFLSTGRETPSFQDHVFRNQSVGSTYNVAGSGPRLNTVILIRMFSGVSFAYSTKTSKYLSSSNIPVSSSSYSSSWRERRRLVAL